VPTTATRSKWLANPEALALTYLESTLAKLYQNKRL
jgi:hypothetical protein